jgi:hypothetical protein
LTSDFVPAKRVGDSSNLRASGNTGGVKSHLSGARLIALEFEPRRPVRFGNRRPEELQHADLM